MCERILTEFTGIRSQSHWKDNLRWRTVVGHIENQHLEALLLHLDTPFPLHLRMKALNNLIWEYLSAKDADGNRVLVFTNFQESMDEMIAHLSANTPSIRASEFIGQSGGLGGGEGMDPMEQNEVSLRLLYL
jgi:ERCC4-related helicase